MEAHKAYRNLFKSLQLIIFFLFLSVPAYTFHLYYLAIDLSKPVTKEKDYLDLVHQHIKSTLTPQLKKNDRIVLVTFSDKTKLIYRRKIQNPARTLKDISKAIRSQKEKGSNTGFFKMLYKAIKRVHKNYPDSPNTNTLIIYSKELSNHKSNKKYEKKINRLIRTFKSNESKILSPIHQIHLYTLPKTHPLVNLKYYSRDILLTKLNRIAKTQIHPLPLKYNVSSTHKLKEQPSPLPQVTPKASGDFSSFFSTQTTTIILSLLGLLLLGGTGGYFYLLSTRKPKYFHGFIEYYDEETTKPKKKILNLARLRKKEFIIGGQKEHDIILRGAYHIEPIVIEYTTGYRKEIRLQTEVQKEFSFIKQSKNGFLTSGDVFRIGTYVLQYNLRL